MTNEMVKQIRHKVKSGCRTCKVRKVKCDEAWPVCLRCQSSGRRCGGYGVWGGGSDATPLPSKQSHTPPKHHALERHPASREGHLLKSVPLLNFETTESECFDWFINRSAKKLPGAFFSEYWMTFLFQASTTVAPIRHAVLALGSAHRQEVEETRLTSTSDERKQIQAKFTLRQYNLAISNLQPYFSNSEKRSIHRLLLVCMFFVYIAFLRQNYTDGLLHLEHGLSILKVVEKQSCGRDPGSMFVDGWFIIIFMRLVVQAKLLGVAIKSPYRNFLSPKFHLTTDTFHSTHQARRSLEHIMFRILDLRDEFDHYPTGYRSEGESSKPIHQHLIFGELRLWLCAYKATVAQPDTTKDPLDYFAYRLLQLYYYMTLIMNETYLGESGEMEYDQCQSTFLQIIAHCISTYKILFEANPSDVDPRLRHHHFDSASGKSVSDIGWITPLYFTAVKCRNHRIRHQALRLLESTNHKEGIFDSVLTVIIARKVIQIEEGNYYDHSNNEMFDKLAMPTTTELASAVLPVGLRLSDIGVTLPDHARGKLFLTCRRPRMDGTIQLIYKVYDITDKQWRNVSSISQHITA